MRQKAVCPFADIGNTRASSLDSAGPRIRTRGGAQVSALGSAQGSAQGVRPGVRPGGRPGVRPTNSRHRPPPVHLSD